MEFLLTCLTSLALVDAPEAEALATARRQRLAVQEQQLRERVAHDQAHPPPESARAALAELVARHDGSSYIETDQGFFFTRTLRTYLRWNRPVGTGGRPLALEAGFEGHPSPIIVDLARQLRSRGIELLVVPVPSRLHTYPEQLLGGPAWPEFRGMAPGTLRMMEELTRSEVEVVDLISAFAAQRGPLRPDGGPGDAAPGGLFLRWDHHWSPRGAEVAARAIAARVLQIPGLDPPEPRLAVHIEETESKHWALPINRRPSRPAERLRYRQVVDDDETVRRRRQDSPVTVIGDSLVDVHEKLGADVCSHLAYLLGRPVDSISIPAGGTRACWETLRRTRDLSRKRVVVWILFLRRLPPGPSWKPIQLFEDG